MCENEIQCTTTLQNKIMVKHVSTLNVQENNANINKITNFPQCYL